MSARRGTHLCGFLAKALLDRARGSTHQRAGKATRALRDRRIEASHIHQGDHVTVGAETGGARATHGRVLRAEVLPAMHCDCPVLGDGCANSDSSFHLLREEAAVMEAPFLENIGVYRVYTVVDNDTLRIAEENGVMPVPNDTLEAVEFV